MIFDYSIDIEPSTEGIKIRIWHQLSGTALILNPLRGYGNQFSCSCAYFRKNAYFCSLIFEPKKGALAHLVERFVRNEKVGGSSPLCSTKKRG